MIEIRCAHPERPGRRETHITVLSEYGFLHTENRAIRSIGSSHDTWNIQCPWCRVTVKCRHSDADLITRFVRSNPALLAHNNLQLFTLRAIVARIAKLRETEKETTTA